MAKRTRLGEGGDVQTIATPFGPVFAEVEKLRGGDILVLTHHGEVDQTHMLSLAGMISNEVETPVVVLPSALGLSIMTRGEVVAILERILESGEDDSEKHSKT